MAVSFFVPLLEGKAMFFLRRENPGRIPPCREPRLRSRQTDKPLLVKGVEGL